jgi:putative hydrolase of the HAD superfamily
VQADRAKEARLIYQAVIFDLFGTLVDSANSAHLIKLFREPVASLDCDADEFMTAWLGIYQDRATGRLGSVANEIKYLCDRMGVQATPDQLQTVLDLRLDAFRRQCEPRTSVPDTLRKLKQMGLKVGLISDCGSEIPDIWPDLALSTLIDEAVFSCSEGTTKPDPTLYRIACERLEVEPSRCIYVGDGGSRELSGASAAGMEPVLIRVDYEHFFDANRADIRNWTGKVISDISEVLDIVAYQ